MFLFKYTNTINDYSKTRWFIFSLVIIFVFFYNYKTVFSSVSNSPIIDITNQINRTKIQYKKITEDITEDTIWKKTDGPYEINGDISILKDKTLNIEPGTEIVFAQKSSLLFYGSLKAIGTEKEHISFYGKGLGKKCSVLFSGENWRIDFFDNSNIDMRYVDILNSYEGVGINDSNFIIKNTYRCGGKYGISIFKSMGAIDNSSIEQTKEGFIANGGNIQIKNSNFFKNTTGLLLNNINIKISSSTISNNDIGIKSNKTEIIVPMLMKNTEEDKAFNNIDVKNNIFFENKYWTILNDSENLIDASFSWWGNISGPTTTPVNLLNLTSDKYERIKGPVIYDNFLTNSPLENDKADCCSNILFIPGIEASRLYIKDEKGKKNKLWEPVSTKDVQKLSFNEQGTPITKGVYVNGAIDVIFNTFSVYKGFFAFLDRLKVNNSINDWETLAYDWRFDIDNIVKSGIQLEDNITDIVSTILDLSNTSKTGKVSIITHSNGGLLAKKIIQSLENIGKANIVDKVFFIAVPQYGTPQAIASLLHGHKQRILFGKILNDLEARDFSRNLPSVYSLLPRETVLNRIQSVINFSQSSSTQNVFVKYGASIGNSFESLSNFLLGSKDTIQRSTSTKNKNMPIKLNERLLANAYDLYNFLDNFHIPDNIKVTSIFGYGLRTVSSIFYKFDDKCSLKNKNPRDCITPQFNYGYGGDGTVLKESTILPFGSTKSINLTKVDNTGFSSTKDHSSIMESEAIQKAIEDEIRSYGGEISSDGVITTFNSSKDLMRYMEVQNNRSYGTRIGWRIHFPKEYDFIVYDEKGGVAKLEYNKNLDSNILSDKIGDIYYENDDEEHSLIVPANKNIKLNIKVKKTQLPFVYISEDLDSTNPDKEYWSYYPFENGDSIEIKISKDYKNKKPFKLFYKPYKILGNSSPREIGMQESDF